MLDGYGTYGITALAADRKRWTLDAKLPAAFPKLERKAAVAEERRQENLRAEERRRQQWEAAMEHARLQYSEPHRLAWLEDQLTRWRKASDLRAFVEAARGEDLDEEDEQWLTQVERMTERIDPLGRPLAPDDPPDLLPSDLQPFMRGLSPYGPTGSGASEADRWATSALQLRTSLAPQIMALGLV